MGWVSMIILLKALEIILNILLFSSRHLNVCSLAALYHTGIKPELVRPLTTKQLQVLQRDESDKATQHWVEESVAAKDEPDYERFKSSFMVCSIMLEERCMCRSTHIQSVPMG